MMNPKKTETVRKLAAAPVAAVLAILALTTVASSLVLGTRGEGKLTRFAEGGPLRIGYAVDPPYAFVDSGGEVNGAIPALARLVAKRLGIERIEWRRLQFGSLINGLESGQIDVIATGMFITRERAAQVAFSSPTVRVREGLLVRAGNPEGLRSYRQAARSPLSRIAVLSGGVEGALLLGMDLAPDRLVRVPDSDTGESLLVQGLVGSFAISAPAVKWMAAHNPKVEEARLEEEPGSQDVGFFAFAFRKSDRRLRERWNQALAELKGSEEFFGSVSAFGFARDDLPGSTSVEEVLAWR
jgi:polar amino acid transport system substrate-binding protein